ncbi:MAG: NAD(P)-dependent oxidoreductase [Alphaproteobacteria bacterium]|jgi:3-hydroxyisobutyrate dehydrogenase-like beta-hydroxyacid dehydrogenase
MMDMKIGWIGAGKMGGPMSCNIMTAGGQVTVFDPVPENVAGVVAAGGTAAASNVALAADSEIVFSMIPNDAVLRSVTLGGAGIFAVMKPGSIYVDMSTVSPEVSAEVSAAAEAAGIAYLRAPVSGSIALAEVGKLTIMVSGPAAAYERCEPIFDAMGAQNFYLGNGDQARYLKLVINLLVGTTGAVLAEALTLGRKGGLDWNQMIDVIGVSAAASPYIQYNVAPLKARDFTPQFTTEQMVKDSRLISEAGHAAGVPLAIGDAMLATFEQTIEAGYGGENLTAAIKMIEAKSGLDEL